MLKPSWDEQKHEATTTPRMEEQKDKAPGITKQTLQHWLACWVGAWSGEEFQLQRCHSWQRRGGIQFFPPFFLHCLGNAAHWLNSAGHSSPRGLGNIAWRLTSQARKRQRINLPINSPRSKYSMPADFWISATIDCWPRAKSRFLSKARFSSLPAFRYINFNLNLSICYIMASIRKLFNCKYLRTQLMEVLKKKEGFKKNTLLTPRNTCFSNFFVYKIRLSFTMMWKESIILLYSYQHLFSFLMMHKIMLCLMIYGILDLMKCNAANVSCNKGSEVGSPNTPTMLSSNQAISIFISAMKQHRNFLPHYCQVVRTR